MKTEPVVFCMSVTPFTATGAIDEEGLRRHLERMVEAQVAVYLASPGSGEGHALSRDELRAVYRLGVEICKGKVPLYANPTESRTVEDALAKARLAIDAGVDVVTLYPVDGGHGMRPIEAEQDAYYRFLLDRIDHPVALAVNLLAGGYGAPIGLFKRLCADYPRIVAINVNQPPTSTLAELMDAVRPGIAFYTSAEMLPEALTLGAKGCMTGQANVVPYLVRSIGRHFVAGDIEACRRSFARLFALNRTVGNFCLDQSVPQLWSPRWIKAAMKALALPGHGEGRMRLPYLSPSAADIDTLARALAAIDLAGAEREARDRIRAAP